MDINKDGKKFEEEISEDLSNLIPAILDQTFSLATDFGSIMPGGSFVFGAIKMINSYRESALIERIIKFYSEIKDVNPESRKKSIKKFNDENSLDEQFGKYFLLILERLDSNIKAQWLGIVFRYYSEGHISTEIYERCNYIIENLYSADLKHLLNRDSRRFLSLKGPKATSLVSIGLLIQEDRKIDRNGKPFSNVYHSYSRFGTLFISVLKGERIDKGYGDENSSIHMFTL